MLKAITNGHIVTEERVVTGDLIIDEAGKIGDILPAGTAAGLYPSGETADARGCYVVPGGIDGHVHFGGFGTVPIADDFYTGSKAALAGGTTTVVDFCESEPGEHPMDCIAKRRQAAECSMADYAFHYSFTKNYKEELTFLDDIAGEGIAAFKAFTYYDNTALGTSEFREIMQAIHDKGTLLVHAEEKSIIDAEKAKVPEDQKTDMRYLTLTRPRVTERLAVESVLTLAEETGTELCIAHTSTGLSADIRRRERLAGNSRFLLETCPHYLHLTQEKLAGPEGALYTMNPPLRTAWDNERLWRAVMEGDISILSTDHCPYHRRYKLGTDYLTVPCGVDGAQTRMLYLFSEGVVKRNLPLTEFAKITSTNAAKFYRLYPRKGVIAKGGDADLTVFDPAAQWTWGAGSIAGATDYTVLEGLRLTGAVSFVVKGGEIVVKNGEVTAAKGSGNYLPAAGT